ncbi:MAG: enhanced intracellular survival protein Eis [Phycisphaerales bacterium]
MPTGGESMVYRPARSEADVAEYARVLSHAFGRPESTSQGWLARYSPSEMRVMCRGDEVLAGLLLFEKGQFWGGRSVPMVGVGAVGVMPEARGKALATRLMRDALLEMRERGMALSCLYPATQTLYRAVGYEQAGHRFEVRVPLHRIMLRERGVEMRQATEADEPAIRALYRAVAAKHPGNIDRAASNWDRIKFPPPERKEAARAFVMMDGERISGYIYLAPVVVEGGKHEVHVQDLCAATPEGWRRLLTFLAGYSTVGTDLVWHGGPSHPLLLLLDEQPYRLTIRHHWMIRIVDAARALAARGYPVGLSTELTIAVRDEVLRGNTGTYRVRLQGGTIDPDALRGADSEKGGADIETDACGLACMYSGFMSASALRDAGMVKGSEESLRRADAAFAGPAGWMTDMF